MATAIATFRGKYDALPGDIPNATALFSTTIYLDNGNGDGQIDDTCSNNLKATPSGPESVNMWFHLSQAGMIWGNYVGGFGTGLGSSYPASSYGHDLGYSFMNNAGGCYLPSFYPGGPVQTDLIIANGGNVQGIGPDNANIKPALTPQEAYSIDSKIDDGLPLSGIAQVYNPSGYWWTATVPSYACATTQVPTAAVYDMSVNTRSCLMFWLKMIPD